MSRRKRLIPIAAALIATVFFLWLAVRGVDSAALKKALRAAEFIWILPMIVVMCVDLLIRALRWRVLLSRARVTPAPVWTLIKLEAIGLAINNVLFLRLGELARAILASRRLDIPVLAAFASVAIERALDVAALLLIFIVAAGAVDGIVPREIVIGAVAVLLGTLGALILLTVAGSSVVGGGVTERALRRWPRIHNLVLQLSLGAVVLRSPWACVQAVFWSVLLWSVDAVLYWAGARVLSLGSLMDYPRSVLALSWAGASSAIPAAPGAVGTFEAVVASILVKFQAGPEEAFAYALVTHMVMYVFVTSCGLFFLSREGISLAQLRQEVEKGS
ncbi:MAG: lysylphosphatidylglycerol synthase transmembrane domain-containing protein [Elusimicrobiota bacterium]